MWKILVCSDLQLCEWATLALYLKGLDYSQKRPQTSPLLKCVLYANDCDQEQENLDRPLSTAVLVGLKILKKRSLKKFPKWTEYFL